LRQVHYAEGSPQLPETPITATKDQLGGAATPDV